MKLYLVRHGKADWPDWKRSDDERPLTEEGEGEMRLVGAALKRMKVSPQAILSSPLPRAMRTAELVGKALGVVVETCPELKPGFDSAECNAILAGRPGADLMLVGHEPDLSCVVRALTGGRLKMPKGGVAAIEVDAELAGSRLLWMFPAKMLIRLYR